MEANCKEEHNVCSGVFDGNKVTFGALSGPTSCDLSNNCESLMVNEINKMGFGPQCSFKPKYSAVYSLGRNPVVEERQN